MRRSKATEQLADSSPVDTVEALWSAIIRRDSEAIVDCYSDTEELQVYLEGPRWQTLGHPAVARGWRAFCESSLHVLSIEAADAVRVFAGHGQEVVGALATVTGMTRMTYDIADQGDLRTVVLRLTWVLRREADRWRIVHEHGSQPSSDPYGTGDWLPAS